VLFRRWRALPSAILVDVPKVKELMTALQRTEKQLQVFQKISRFMVREMSLPEVLQGIVSLVVEFMGCDSCLLYLFDRGELVLCASNDSNSPAVGNVRLKLSEGLTGWVARERRLLALTQDAYTDPRFKPFRSLPEDAFEAFLSAPVIARNRVEGVINVQHRLPHQHTGSEMELLTTVGEQVGCLVALARMEPEAIDSVVRPGRIPSPVPIMPGS
jgi:uroporphyrinogen-III synthase